MTNYPLLNSIGNVPEKKLRKFSHCFHAENNSLTSFLINIEANFTMSKPLQPQQPQKSQMTVLILGGLNQKYHV